MKLPEPPRRSLPARLSWILAVGVFLAGQAYLFLCVAAWASASLPYQDGPIDLLRKQQRELEEGWREVKVAAVVAGASSLWLVGKVVRARAERTTKGSLTP